MTEQPELINQSQIRPVPIGHASLPPGLLHQIKAVFDVVGLCFGKTLE